MENRTAIITGVNGQDGSYLAELLLEKNYKVVGIARRSSQDGRLARVAHLINENNFMVVEGDVTDPLSINEVVRKYEPTEFYHLAAQSHVHTSFEQPTYTFQVNATGTLNCLEAVRQFAPQCRFYHAATSEMFGSNFSEILVDKSGKPVLDRYNYTEEDLVQYFAHPKEIKKVQNELTSFHPRSPYAVSKVAAFNLVVNYRESYGLFALSGVLFNHEGPRRGENFLTQKVCRYIGRLVNGQVGQGEKLMLGNLTARRDWGHVKDYVKGMWAMLQQNRPDDFVLATGETHTVEEFVALAFSSVQLDWRNYVQIDEALVRPAEVEYLLGDASKAKRELGWEATVSFKELVSEMVESAIRKYKNG